MKTIIKTREEKLSNLVDIAFSQIMLGVYMSPNMFQILGEVAVTNKRSAADEIAEKAYESALALLKIKEKYKL